MLLKLIITHLISSMHRNSEELYVRTPLECLVGETT